MGEEKRHQMMQNLFGDQSEEEEEIDSEHESNPQPIYASDEAEGGLEPEGEGEVDVEGHGEAEPETDGEPGDVEPDPGESEGEREQSWQEGDVGNQREESEARDADSENKEEYEERVATSRRQNVVESGSERSDGKHYEYDDEEVDQTRSPRSPSEEKDEAHVSQSADEIRHVFGDSEDEDAEEYVRNAIEQDEHRSPIEDEVGYEKDLRPEDMVPEEDTQYESEGEHVEVRYRERPIGPPLEIEVPFRSPPGDPTKLNMIKVSNIMGIDPKPFDPKTFVEEDTFVTDESGAKKRIRLENNIVRYKAVKNRDGKTYYESNARFVRWSDGSLQLLIGNEVLDISVQDAQQDQNHLFIKHGKGILQSQGRVLKKMRFIPSSLSSNSHRLLTALVDSRHKKVYKVKNCITDIDPEREKEKREKVESQNIKANMKLSQAREKIKRKYPPPAERRQLSTGYLEGALDEDEETDHYGSHRSNRSFEEDLEAEAQRERRIMNAKKYQSHRDIPRRPSSAKPSRRPVEFSESEREESEYETEGEDEERSPPRKRIEEPEDEYEEEAEEDEEEEQEEDAKANRYSEEEEEPEDAKGRKRKGIESDEESPPRKAPTHRRMAIVYDSDED
ncbi:PREDICTED: protein LEO1 homolog isoform X2 [Tarenaya hassleriana]|uniref:protein LEO1 homolog isoform X2 n=1 Tax=Tarenaya hassleriana TaxID=28532 RepID=UPI00053C7433|nr:PREDICTED: protein LEO1 homolog isoform X2 [Tarenaya hassleriana]